MSKRREFRFHYQCNCWCNESEIQQSDQVDGKIGPQAELIVYYAGHGFPDEITKEPYLVPVDVSGTDLSAAIKLEDLYRDLEIQAPK